MPFNRFLAFGSYVCDILVLYRVYFSTCSLMFIVWVLPIWRQSGFKKLDSKKIGARSSLFLRSVVLALVNIPKLGFPPLVVKNRSQSCVRNGGKFEI